MVSGMDGDLLVRSLAQGRRSVAAHAAARLRVREAGARLAWADLGC